MDRIGACDQPSADRSTVARLIENARAARAIVESWSQDRVDEVVAAVAWHAFKDTTARRLSELAVRETGLGSVEDTYLRHQQRVLGVMRDLDGVSTVGVVETCPRLGLRKIAKPVGIIAAMTPATAPVAAVAVHALTMLKTRNAVIFCPNPSAKGVVAETVEVLQAALDQVGAPRQLLQYAGAPSRELANQLMASADLVVASGGRGTVARAYASGTPAYGAGVGNAVVLVDETADLAKAARLIVAGKAFDNGTSCSSESSLVIAASIHDRLIEELQACGAYLCSEDQARRLRATAWPDGRSLSRKVVGRSAADIAEQAGIAVPAGATVLMIAGENLSGQDPVAGEKLSPILGLWRYAGEIENGIEVVKSLISLHGCGHSCGIYSSSEQHVDRLGAVADVGRVMVNQSTAFGNSGSFDNGMPVTVVLSCGTWGGSSTTENIGWRHYLNYTWISDVIARAVPDQDSLFEAHWARYGR